MLCRSLHTQLCCLYFVLYDYLLSILVNCFSGSHVECGGVVISVSLQWHLSIAVKTSQTKNLPYNFQLLFYSNYSIILLHFPNKLWRHALPQKSTYVLFVFFFVNDKRFQTKTKRKVKMSSLSFLRIDTLLKQEIGSAFCVSVKSLAYSYFCILLRNQAMKTRNF